MYNHVKLHRKHCVLIKRTKIFSYKKMIKQALDTAKTEKIPFEKALEKNKEEDLAKR